MLAPFYPAAATSTETVARALLSAAMTRQMNAQLLLFPRPQESGPCIRSYSSTALGQRVCCELVPRSVLVIVVRAKPRPLFSSSPTVFLLLHQASTQQPRATVAIALKP